MGTPVDKLSYLLDTKAAIREAIESKGQTITDADTFRSYADKIGSISTSDASAPKVSVTAAGKITATSSGGTTNVTLSSSHDSDFKAANIKSGVTIFGVTGSYSQTPVVETVTTNTSWSASSQYLTLSASQNIGTICSLYATISGSDCNAVFLYDASNNNAFVCYSSGGGMLSGASGSIGKSGKTINITIPGTVGYLQMCTRVVNAVISYIPA